MGCRSHLRQDARPRALLAALGVAAALLAGPAPAQAASDQPTWAPVASATIRPGVQVSSESGGCTSNFVVYERRVDSTGTVGFEIYLGTAAHCFSLGGASDTNACTTPSRPLGTRATVRGAAHPATLAYSSWRYAQATGEEDPNVCAVNDFALLRLDPRDHAKVNPSLLHFGGPTGTRTTGTALGERVLSYGNSSLRLGLQQLSPKRGTGLGTGNNGWSHRVYTATPGIPGDSGSGVLDAQGRALGVLVTLQAAPYAGSNGVTDLSRALAYARGKTGRDYRLAPGTLPFADRLLP